MRIVAFYLEEGSLGIAHHSLGILEDNLTGAIFSNLDVDSFYPLKRWTLEPDLQVGHFTIDSVDSLDCHCIHGSYEFWLRRTRDDVPVEQREVIRIYDDAFCIDIGDIIYIDDEIEH